MYPKEFEIKDYSQRNLRLKTTDVPKWANDLDLHLAFDEDDKDNTFYFPIVNLLYLGNWF